MSVFLDEWRRPLGIIWTIVIGFVAGIIAKFLHPGPNEPAGFVLTIATKLTASIWMVAAGVLGFIAALVLV
jgi:hypothetical protein